MKKNQICKKRSLSGPSNDCPTFCQLHTFTPATHIKFTAKLIILLILIINPGLNFYAQQNDSITFFLEQCDYQKVISLNPVDIEYFYNFPVSASCTLNPLLTIGCKLYIK